MKNGIPIKKLIQALQAIYVTCGQSPTVDTDDSQPGVIRVNYNGPLILDLTLRHAEALDAVNARLRVGYAEIPIP